LLSTLFFRIASNGKTRSFPHHCIAPQREIKVPVVLRLLGTWMQVDRRNETKRGCPFGEASWSDQMVRHLGLEMTLRPQGHPKRLEGS